MDGEKDDKLSWRTGTQAGECPAALSVTTTQLRRQTNPIPPSLLPISLISEDISWLNGLICLRKANIEVNKYGKTFSASDGQIFPSCQFAFIKE